jgi:hypothetical protein
VSSTSKKSASFGASTNRRLEKPTACLFEARDQQRGDAHEADDLADRGETDEFEVSPDQKDHQERERSAGARQHGGAAHQDSTGICARNSEFTRLFRPDTSSSMRA